MPLLIYSMKKKKGKQIDSLDAITLEEDIQAADDSLCKMIIDVMRSQKKSPGLKELSINMAKDYTFTKI